MQFWDFPCQVFIVGSSMKRRRLTFVPCIMFLERIKLLTLMISKAYGIKWRRSRFLKGAFGDLIFYRYITIERVELAMIKYGNLLATILEMILAFTKQDGDKIFLSYLKPRSKLDGSFQIEMPLIAITKAMERVFAYFQCELGNSKYGFLKGIQDQMEELAKFTEFELAKFTMQFPFGLGLSGVALVQIFIEEK